MGLSSARRLVGCWNHGQGPLAALACELIGDLHSLGPMSRRTSRSELQRAIQAVSDEDPLKALASWEPRKKRLPQGDTGDVTSDSTAIESTEEERHH
jgi:hypothetical protein